MNIKRFLTILLIFFSINLSAKEYNKSNKDYDSKPESEEQELKPLGLLMGLIPNSDGLLDTLAGFNINYWKSTTGFEYKNINRARLVKTKTEKKSGFYSEKSYLFTLWKLQRKGLDLGITYFSIGISGRYIKVEEDLNFVRYGTTGRIFINEERSSEFIQPSIPFSLFFEISSQSYLLLTGYASPYQVQKTKITTAMSTETEDFSQSKDDTGMEYQGGLELKTMFSNNEFYLGVNALRRLSIISIDVGIGTSHSFETATSVLTELELQFKWGLRFLSKHMRGAFPVLFFSYYYNNTIILAENVDNDQDIEDKGFRFGLVINMGSYGK